MSGVHVRDVRNDLAHCLPRLGVSVEALAIIGELHEDGPATAADLEPFADGAAEILALLERHDIVTQTGSGEYALTTAGRFVADLAPWASTALGALPAASESEAREWCVACYPPDGGYLRALETLGEAGPAAVAPEVGVTAQTAGRALRRLAASGRVVSNGLTGANLRYRLP